jgi:hypothetical protein
MCRAAVVHVRLRDASFEMQFCSHLAAQGSKTYSRSNDRSRSVLGAVSHAQRDISGMDVLKGCHPNVHGAGLRQAQSPLVLVRGVFIE